jgi:hypothetical protein
MAALKPEVRPWGGAVRGKSQILSVPRVTVPF